MGRISIAYIHEGKWPPGSVDIHIIEKSLRKAVFAAILLIPIACIFLSLKEISATLILWRLQLSGLLLSESVIIMPAFGVQLETHYTSGRIIRRFIPAGEILKPVLLECVTPVTCYWSLSLLVRGKEELVLVFKELHPPMKMLLPVWKALCASIDNKEGPDTCGEGEDG
ncbi:hypothetical protein E1A91_D03G002100v1 [Gossypium mustelinum]|uniref:Phosphatidylinositol N-acetylglucosaminyltransferase subunit H conserved domain-containing protein n=1 Tax=Gossypium mustelinum TaxID=34275 RepID=A0A5D2VHG6_GOSMU|nr:hypothetical protein E1A91_D03G002100v1 [Gossypium mustelinum]